jgi:plasmid maintenance system killer protein
MAPSSTYVAQTLLRFENSRNVRVPGQSLTWRPNRLEALKGDRKGQYSIRVNDRWRICFLWRSGDAYEVEIEDYH